MGQISETDYGFKLMNLRSKLCLLTSDNKKVKTFSIDDLLPSLPLPTLKQTINNYLKSIKPFVDKLEYLSMEKKLEDFRIGQGKVLQFHLRSKAKKEKNWLETWWLNWTYLESKNPLIPYSNGAGIFLDLNQDPYANLKLTLLNIQITKAAAYVHFCNKFFEEVRNESLKVHKSRSNYLNMDQFRRFFNICRVPGENKDQIVTHFKTVNEGQCPTHLIVIYKNRFFMMDAYHEDKKSLLNIGEIYNQLNHIVNNTSSFGIGIGALTADKRDSWAKNRKYLINLDNKNQKYLDIIEKAMYIVNLDDDVAQDNTEMIQIAFFKNSKNRFYDKTFQMVVSKNGKIGSNIEQAAFESTLTSSITEFILKEEQKANLDSNHFLQENTLKPVNKPEELEFEYDSKIEFEIEKCQILHSKNASEIEIKNLILKDLTKEKSKLFKIKPDTVTQMAIQLAYYQLHNKPAPTYETATTRAYYHGRTETVRSCSMEAVEWCREMCNKDPQSRLNNKQLLDLFKRACNKHDSLMIEARQNAGCDRHLLGLMLMSKELNFDLPDIFTNDAWKKSGGGENFLISTSCVGYGPFMAVCAPFCRNGYSVYYSFSSIGIGFVLARYTTSSETNLAKFSESLQSAFFHIQSLFYLNPKL